jgi:hypothetical protein
MNVREMNQLKTFATFAIVVSAMSACVTDKSENADSTAVSSHADSATLEARKAVVPPGETAPPPPPVVAPSAPVGEWEVTPTGIGAVKTGISIDEAQILLHNDLAIPANLAECAFVKTKSGPKGVALMVEQRNVTRVDVTSGPTATSAGVRVGDTEEKVKSAYPNRITVTPHKYNAGGHYLTYTPANGGGKIVFETDGNEVTKFRSGTTPSVDNVEGCG